MTDEKETRKHGGNGGNGGSSEVPAHVSLAQPYLIDVNDLRKTVQEMGEKLANADSHNDRVLAICSALAAADVKFEIIEAALNAEFGKPKMPRKSSPHRKNPVPNGTEESILAVLTGEPMNKRAIFSAAKLYDDENTRKILSEMKRFGWIDNVGGKGKGAGWVLTEAGLAHLQG